MIHWKTRIDNICTCNARDGWKDPTYIEPEQPFPSTKHGCFFDEQKHDKEVERRERVDVFGFSDFHGADERGGGDVGGGGSSREQELCGREAGEHVVEHGLEGLRDAEKGDGGVGRGRGDGEGAFCLGVEGVLGVGCENCGCWVSHTGCHSKLHIHAVIRGKRNGDSRPAEPGD
jgi:hypothetical protein